MGYTLRMLYAYFGGTGATGIVRYEVLLLQDGSHYTVVAEHYRPQASQPTPRRVWLPACPSDQIHFKQTRLYHGRDALTALRTVLRAACQATNSAHLGQRYCYVLPAVRAGGGQLAPLVPLQLRHNNALPEHPQLWQTGRSLVCLPPEHHAHACLDRRMFGDERITWAWA